MECFVLRGYVEDVSSKRGIRYVNFGASIPYDHNVMVDVVGDEGREDDDSLTADLWPFCEGEVVVSATLDSHGCLTAKPSDFARPTPDRSGEADKTAKQGLAEGESGLPEGSSR